MNHECLRLAKSLIAIRTNAPVTVAEATALTAASEILRGWDWAELEAALSTARAEAEKMRAGMWNAEIRDRAWALAVAQEDSRIAERIARNAIEARNHPAVIAGAEDAIRKAEGYYDGGEPELQGNKD